MKIDPTTTKLNRFYHFEMNNCFLVLLRISPERHCLLFYAKQYVITINTCFIFLELQTMKLKHYEHMFLDDSQNSLHTFDCTV